MLIFARVSPACAYFPTVPVVASKSNVQKTENEKPKSKEATLTDLSRVYIQRVPNTNFIELYGTPVATARGHVISASSLLGGITAPLVGFLRHLGQRRQFLRIYAHAKFFRCRHDKLGAIDCMHV